jgi:ubiquinone/menaquinone biosynthesis C-methylase UbiE
MDFRGHEVLFSMMREYVRPGQSVLDLGIGTGLLAALFHRASLRVYGVDNSEEMLKVCAEKSVTEELKVCDISRPGWPYGDETFDHVTACGVFHFIRDPDVVFSEAARVLKPGGSFDFTVKGMLDGKTEYNDKGSGIRINCHGDAVIDALIARHGFGLLKRMTYWTYNDLDMTERSFFELYVTEKKH